jgi:hypothetical protein
MRTVGYFETKKPRLAAGLPSVNSIKSAALTLLARLTLAALLAALTGLLLLLLLPGLLSAALLAGLILAALLLLARLLVGILVLVHSISFQRYCSKVRFEEPRPNEATFACGLSFHAAAARSDAAACPNGIFQRRMSAFPAPPLLRRTT